jgi:hypothetical protein
MKKTLKNLASSALRSTTTKKPKSKTFWDFDSALEPWNAEGKKHGEAACNLVQPFINKLVKEGFPIRQIESLIKYEVDRACGAAILLRASGRIKVKK